MYIEGISVFPVCLKVSRKVPLLSQWYQVISCTWKVSHCSECISRCVSLKVSLFPQCYLKVSHVHRRHLKVYLTVVAEGILQGISQGCSQGATQSLSHDIFDPGLGGIEVDVLHVDAPVAWRIRAGGSSHGDP